VTDFNGCHNMVFARCREVSGFLLPTEEKYDEDVGPAGNRIGIAGTGLQELESEWGSAKKRV